MRRASNQPQRRFDFNRLLEVPVTDPEEARRRKLLNIILSSVGVLAVLIALIGGVWYWLGAGGVTPTELAYLELSSLTIVVMTGVIYLLNRSRRVPGWVAAGVFLIFFCILASFSDTPRELSAGRSLFVWTIPIVLAAFLLRPWGSFLFTGLVTLEMLVLANYSQQQANPTAIIGFVLLAGVTWLAAHNLEQALREVRAVNVNLDRLVQERTQALEDALIREHVAFGQLQATLESLRDGVIVFDRQGKVVVANPPAAALFETRREAMLTRSILELVGSRPLRPQERGVLLGLLTAESEQALNRTLRWGSRHLAVWVAPVYSGGTTDRIGTILVLQDITAEVEAARMKDMFLAMVSHELRTPINSILGYTDILLAGMRGELSPEQVETLERIARNGQHLLELVSDLLDQAQIQAGTLKIAAEPFEIDAVLQEVRNACERSAENKGLALVIHREGNLPTPLLGDARRVRQIILNLVTNAIKFTEQGAVHVRVFAQDKTHWAVEVRDTGIGIPEDKLVGIFDPFYQVESSPTRRAGGFGLGLAIVKNLVDLMGGTIKVKSRVGVGSVFTVILPVKPPKKARRKAPSVGAG